MSCVVGVLKVSGPGYLLYVQSAFRGKVPTVTQPITQCICDEPLHMYRLCVIHPNN